MIDRDAFHVLDLDPLFGAHCPPISCRRWGCVWEGRDSIVISSFDHLPMGKGGFAVAECPAISSVSSSSGEGGTINGQGL